MRVSLSHIDTCLGCYLTDHHNRKGELLLGVYVDNTTTIGDISEALNNEIDAADYGLPSWFNYDQFRSAIDDELPATTHSMIFDASLDPPCDDDMSESCQAWFLVTYSRS